MNWLLVGPIALPLSAAVIGFCLRGSDSAQRAVSLIAALGLSGLAATLLVVVWQNGITVSQMGGWPAPFGITLVADHLSSVMVAVTAVIGLATVIYSFGNTPPGEVSYALHPLVHALLAGVCGAFLAGDIFNLYVWFEVMLIASFALLVLGGTRSQLDGAVRYAALSLIATTLLLSGIGLLYGLTGTLNMADLHLRVQEVENQGLLTVVAVLFIIAFRHQVGRLPTVFLASGQLPHAETRSLCHLFRTIDQSGRVRAHACIHADFHPRRRLHPRIALVGGRRNHGDRCSRRRLSARTPPHSLLPYHQSDRLHDPRDRLVH